jgi:hypothetical protein
MAVYSDWLPGARAEQIEMAKNWIGILTASPAEWQFPPAELARLQAAETVAAASLDIVMSADRTQALTAKCNEDFDALKAVMRDIKDRYFKIPPLDNAALVAFGLKPKDGTRTPVRRPDIQLEILVSSPGVHQLTLHFSSQAGAVSADPRSLKTRRTRGGIMLPTGPATPEEAAADPRLLTKVPARPEDLPMIIDENRKTHGLNLRVDDTGKTFYYSGCYLNSAHEEGPYCPIPSRLIP